MTHHTDDGKPPSTDRKNIGSAIDEIDGSGDSGSPSGHTGSHHTSPDGGLIDNASSPGLST